MELKETIHIAVTVKFDTDGKKVKINLKDILEKHILDMVDVDNLVDVVSDESGWCIEALGVEVMEGK